MNIFVLTGAGIYAESGLGSFRGKTGLRTRFDPMKLARLQKRWVRDQFRLPASRNAAAWSGSCNLQQSACTFG
jgi:NAD-dependent SIR2 family protein deacetylase